jgi:hypothetical protein
MLRRVALVRTVVSEKLNASIIRMTRISEPMHAAKKYQVMVGISSQRMALAS